METEIFEILMDVVPQRRAKWFETSVSVYTFENRIIFTQKNIQKMNAYQLNWLKSWSWFLLFENDLVEKFINFAVLQTIRDFH